MAQCHVLYHRVPGEQEHLEFPIVVDLSRVPCVGEALTVNTTNGESVTFSVKRVEHHPAGEHRFEHVPHANDATLVVERERLTP